MPDPLHLQKATRTVGKVDSVDPDAVVITTSNGQQQRLWTTNETRVSRATVGRRRDVHTGARIIVKNHPDRIGEALEIVVLPKATPYGLPVVAAAPDSVTFKGLGGNLTTVKTRRARIDTTTNGDLSDVEPGSTVLARVAMTESGELAGAYEIIVLPDDTTFGA
jgi:hypothetical protein